MTYEDKKLTCSHCKNEFVFTAGEQEFYAEKGLESEPKRCKPCRDAKKRAKRPKKNGIYRSPAFENSAPAHQKMRGRGPGGRGGQGRGRGRGYRSPGLNDKPPRKDEYRSPAFRDTDVIKPEEEYRAPGFREYEEVKPEEEYRSPGFQELSGLDVREEYRAPGFQGQTKKYIDEKPMFSIVCAACGIEAMVPILPDERDDVFCPECHKKRKAAEAAAKAEAEVKEKTATTDADTPSSAETAPGNDAPVPVSDFDASGIEAASPAVEDESSPK